MPDENTKNYASINFGDNPELVSEFSDMKAGDKGTMRIEYTVRRNEDSTLAIDVNGVVLPEAGSQPVSTDPVDAEGQDVIGEVLNRESPSRAALDAK
jgi:hypothetical protein